MFGDFVTITKFTNMKKLATFFVALFLGSLALSTAHAQSADTTFKPSGKLSMQFFGDYFYQIASDTAPSRGKQYYSGNPKFYQAFDIRRVYLGYDYNFSKDVSTQLLLAHENGAYGKAVALTGVKSAADTTGKITNTTTTTGIVTNSSGDIVLDGNRGIYIKAANLRFKGWVPNATVIFGQQGTYAFALPEAMWGYRSIEKTVMDARGLAGSNDLGIALAGTADKDGMIGYSFMISNGNGAKVESDKYKKFAADVNVKLLDRALAIDIYGDLMDLNQFQRQTTVSAFAGYTSEAITAGVQYAMQTLSTETVGSAPPTDDVTPNALSVFARATILPKQLMAFARYDIWNPNSKNTTTLYKENFITAGLDWQPDASANAHIMPNVWINSYAEQGSLRKMDADVVGRMTFMFKF